MNDIYVIFEWSKNDETNTVNRIISLSKIAQESLYDKG
ncbi:hypothetical protein LbDm2_0119 [Levilactobacillus brevis]|uniref:Uncharacterized protein n=1 Tax=Levilactobacillus brevis KB290 TaxID=1001583 RepID=M5B057_LEVBR|nr:hypothetical protein LbDm2_0119 [Levilactobacillus brevis]BAN06836.1 hypothetical protein LVISKB_1201 [Levilactobacillus brevis KB290]